jgi:uncharacterized protein
MSSSDAVSSFDPKVGIRYIRDPIYSYISFTKDQQEPPANSTTKNSSEHDLLSDPWVQRLRRIKQTQAGYTVFPSLEHSRFTHVLGVMHLAGRMARKWYGHLFNRLQEQGREEFLKGCFPPEYVEEIFRLAGLLHDIGHGPFSHSLDNAYEEIWGDKRINHEFISTLIIQEKLSSILSGIRRSPNGSFTDKIDPDLVKWIISPDETKYTEPRYFWLRPMKAIISGPYDADSIDYLSRDAYHAGLLEYGLLDVDRFVENTFFVFDEEVGRNGLCLQENSLPAFEHLLMSRYQMYETCYYHKDVRAFELKATILLSKTLRVLNIPNPKSHPAEFLKVFLDFDEYSLFGSIPRWKTDPDPQLRSLAEEWENFALRRHGLTLAYKKEQIVKESDQAGMIRRHQVEDYKHFLVELMVEWKTMPDPELQVLGFDQASITTIRSLSAEEVLDNIRFDTPYLDLRRGINPIVGFERDTIKTYDRRRPNDLDEINLFERIKRLPVAYLPLRAYVLKPDLKSFVGKALAQAYEKFLPSQSTSH